MPEMNRNKEDRWSRVSVRFPNPRRNHRFTERLVLLAKPSTPKPQITNEAAEPIQKISRGIALCGKSTHTVTPKAERMMKEMTRICATIFDLSRCFRFWRLGEGRFTPQPLTPGVLRITIAFCSYKKRSASNTMITITAGLIVNWWSTDIRAASNTVKNVARMYAA